MKVNFLFLAVLLSFPIAYGRDGSGSSGGGNAVVCYDQETIKSVELLDIYEARTVYKLNLKKPLGSIEKEYIRYVKDSRAALGSEVKVSEESLLKHLNATLSRAMKFIPEGQVLPTQGDIGITPTVPSNCKIEQLAVFYDMKGFYEVDKKLWNRMDSLNRLALFIHEVTFSQYRRLGEVNSENVRAYTASVFSVENATRVHISFPDDTVYCHLGTNVLVNNSESISIDWGKNFAVIAFFENRNKKGEMLGQFFDSFFGRDLTSITQFSLPFIIKMEDLVLERNEKNKSQVAVIEPSANYIETSKLISTTPQLYRVKVNYRYGETFSFSLLDSQEREVLNMPFSYCFQNPK